MKAITEIRKITGEQCFLSGMSAIVEDTKELAEKETPLYVLIAVALSALVLAITMESIFVPVLFLLSIGIAIVYNLGTNVFLERFLISRRHWQRYFSSVSLWTILFS